MNITEINRAAELTLGYTEKEENKTFFTLPPDGISIDKVEKELINQALYDLQAIRPKLRDVCP